MREITFFTFSSDRPRDVNQIVFGMWASFRELSPDRNFPDLQGAEVADGQRRGRVVSPERAAKDLSDLRTHAQSEERVADGQLRFRRTDGDVTQSLLYDERIGAVVETAIERAGRRHIVIKNEFDRNAEGAVLTGVVSEWFDTDGQPVRRVTQRFLSQ